MKMKQWIIIGIGCLGGALLLVFVAMGVLYGCETRAFVRARHVMIASPEQAVVDARQLILDFQRTRNNGQDTRWIEVDGLPKSLKIPKLRFAAVFTNHLNLVTGKNPD